MRGLRRRWMVAVVVVVLVVVGTIRLLDQPLLLESYRPVGPETLEVTGYGAKSAWTRVTGVTETDATVTVAANSFSFQPFPGTAAAYRIEIEVPLDAPLGTREVIDGSTGQPIVPSLPD